MARNQMGFLTGAFDSVRLMERHQRTQMRQFVRQDDVVHLLARARPHVHVRWAVAGGLDGPQCANDPPAFIREYRDSHLFNSDPRRQNVSLGRMEQASAQCHLL